MSLSRVALAPLALLGLLFTSCGSESSAAPATPDPAAVTAKLAAADTFDGKTDQIVAKCAGCALGMDGAAENTLEIEGYSLHFCKAGCKDKFAEDSEANILALAVPAK